ncbi:hypothetical protein LWI29_008287 [Acer saccharum]|uniref:Uncharacterized protein n=1 Tax=Acer saccharum TaxID=4024 RepID=A0AA39UGZ4_ACESA|nr:hypothetical protein LWI29_008287 [Acer saccharum]
MRWNGDGDILGGGAVRGVDEGNILCADGNDGEAEERIWWTDMVHQWRTRCIDLVHQLRIGNWVVRASTLQRRSYTLSIKEKLGDVTNFMKSWSFDPLTDCLASRVICTPSWMKSATATNSFSANPLVVMAGDPMRMPPGTSALLLPY